VRITQSQLIVFVGLAFVMPLSGQSPDSTSSGQTDSVVEDFQGYRSGDSPYTWKRVEGRRLIDVPELLDRDKDYFEIIEESSNRFARLFVDDESTQIVRPNERGFDWNLQTHPFLKWDWRAIALPEGADERRKETNDTGAAVYVTFSRDILGRPKSIKYAYSSSAPAGTVVRYGRLIVIVVNSGADGIGSWQRVTRNVASDYRLVFGGEPPNRPLSITLWGDSDNTHSTARADFDNLTLSATH
jgi:hypothetical protein